FWRASRASALSSATVLRSKSDPSKDVAASPIIPRSLPLFPLPATDCSQAPPFPTDGAWYPLSLVSELQAKLNRTRLVTLRADRSEASGAEVRVRIAEVGPVKDISELGIEPHGQLLVEFEDLEYAR